MAKNKKETKEIPLSELIHRLQAKRIVSTSSDKDRAAIEYSIILTVAETEQLEKQALGGEQ